MRPQIADLVKNLAQIMTYDNPVYEFGSYIVYGQESLANMRPYFQGRDYIGTDMRPGNGVDVVYNMCTSRLQEWSVGLALCLDTIEHVEYPYTAISNIHHALKPGGAIILSSVMNFPIHDHPSDYWRFTHEAFMVMLRRDSCILKI